ncbi:hypothetical protein [Winslowiella toletana]|uniref:hypothetical protein n=1 Tax=Winslowiella toletana TaxID=92490 RepID=UPI0012FEC7B4|nr:hypothetical protein [Winslowiella toletana]
MSEGISDKEDKFWRKNNRFIRIIIRSLSDKTFLGSAWKRENILRQGYLLTSKVSATTLIAAAVVFLRPVSDM